MPVFLSALRKTEADGDGQGRLRIMLRAPERQPAEQKRRLIEEVTRIAREEFPDEASEVVRGHSTRGAEVTGFFVLLTSLIESMLRDQWTTFAIASGSIALLVGVGFRSWKYALIALVPNAVPIYVVMGLMGWLNLAGLADLKINMGSAMIAAVSMGMSVDSSIHYFASFRRARREGKSIHAALHEVQQSVGAAMIFSTIALTVGFGVLITSDFVPTIYFGTLMCLAMLGGMLGNLIVLPLLLSWTER
jgi:predicted RND superfamily exporter protein